VPADQLVVLGGGDGPHRVVRYLLESDTPIEWSGTSPVTFTERSTGRVIVEGPTSASRDYAFVMVVTEPIGGTWALSAQGIGENGTVAAASWFATEIAPAIDSASYAWVIVEWTEADAVPGPSAGDAWIVVESA
jgi:hypothetical protein